MKSEASPHRKPQNDNESLKLKELGVVIVFQ